MKKIIILLLIIIPIKVSALSSYVVMDYDSKRVLEGKNINSKMLIASTTKIMSAVIALENADIKSEVTVSNDVLKAYGSAIYIEVGEKLTLEDLLYGLMLRSGNDAAIEIARVVAGSMDNFVKLMNEKARSIGMTNTLFINNHGLEDSNDNGNMSTSYDMALLMAYALKNETFKKIINTKERVVKTNYKTYVWKNKNKLLSSYKYTIGGKTGFTKKAKRTLVTAAKKGNKTIIVVTLNDPNDFLNHKKYYENNFKKYNLVRVINKNDFKIDNVLYDGNLYIKEDYKMLLTKDEEKKINIEYDISNASNFSDGEKIGDIIVKLDNKEISREDIFIRKQNDNKKNWFQKLIDTIIFWR